MALDNKKEGLLERSSKSVIPAIGTIATIVALVTVDDPYIKYPAIVAGMVLTAITAYPLVAHALRAIHHIFFPRRLSSVQVETLSILLRDSDNYVSYHHSFSVFHAWNSHAGKLGIGGERFQDYHHAIKHHFFDICDVVRRFPKDHRYTLRRLSMALQNICTAAKRMGLELEAAIQKDGVDAELRKRVRQDWNETAAQFNMWIKDWEKVFKAANHSLGADCAEYFPQVSSIS